MATSDFFKQVIAHTPALAGPNAAKTDITQQTSSPIAQAIFQCIQKRHHLACTLPLQAHSPALYALPALMSQGMAVVVCPDHNAILRNMDFFNQNGFTYPDVCYLDPTVLPHDTRDIEQQIENNRVKLLLTTPETFDTLNFIDYLVHSNISFVGVELADCLFAPMQGRFRYDRLKEALSRFRRKPPLVFFFNSLPESTLENILAPLELQNTPTTSTSKVELLSHFPKTDHLQITVHRLSTRHQKHKRLVDILLQPADLATPVQNQALLGRLFSPGAAVIRVPTLDAGEELQEYLLQYGFDLVHLWHPNLERQQKRQLEKSFTAEPNQIMLAVADGYRYLKAGDGSHLKLIEWQLPNSLEELMSNWLRISTKQEQQYEHALTCHLLFTKDEWQSLRNKIQPLNLAAEPLTKNRQTGITAQTRLDALKRLEQWLNTDICRRQSFIAAWDSELAQEFAPEPCGLCDICQKQEDAGWQRLAKPLFTFWKR